MSTSRTATRASTTARTELIGQLQDDHKRVKKAYREFKKIDAQEDPDACEAIVRQVLDELTVHAALEEEMLYPAARDALEEDDLIDEAEVEHASMHSLIDQLRASGADEPKFAARFTVLCEYVLHHVKEEEGELFPKLEKASIDWPSLATAMDERRLELTAPAMDDGEAGQDAAATRADEVQDEDEPVGRMPQDEPGHRSGQTPRRN